VQKENENLGLYEEKKEEEEDKEEKEIKEIFKKKHSAYHKIGACSLKGISAFEIINFLMILFTFLNTSLKYLYDNVV